MTVMILSFGKSMESSFSIKKTKINTNKLPVIVYLLIGLSVKINKICFHFKTIYIKTKQTVENINTGFFLINVMNIIVLNVEG
mgnify:CR=1 FL=1